MSLLCELFGYRPVGKALPIHQNRLRTFIYPHDYRRVWNNSAHLTEPKQRILEIRRRGNRNVSDDWTAQIPQEIEELVPGDVAPQCVKRARSGIDHKRPRISGDRFHQIVKIRRLISSSSIRSSTVTPRALISAKV